MLCSENAAAVAEGLTLASYKYEEYKKGDEDKLTAVHLVIQDAASRVTKSIESLPGWIRES